MDLCFNKNNWKPRGFNFWVETCEVAFSLSHTTPPLPAKQQQPSLSPSSTAVQAVAMREWLCVVCYVRVGLPVMPETWLNMHTIMFNKRIPHYLKNANYWSKGFCRRCPYTCSLSRENRLDFCTRNKNILAYRLSGPQKWEKVLPWLAANKNLQNKVHFCFLANFGLGSKNPNKLSGKSPRWADSSCMAYGAPIYTFFYKNGVHTFFFIRTFQNKNI